MKKLVKKIRYLLEALIVKFGILFFRVIGVKNAANLGSFLARLVGKRHSTHQLAKENMKKALNLSDEEIDQELDKMWDNLGRIVGEYGYISSLDASELVEECVILNEESLRNINLIKNNDKKGGIIFSGHIGNWEIGPKTFLEKGFDVQTVYRPLNNPYVEDMTAKIRGTKLIPKGSKGNREIIDAVRKGKYVIILADQKISEGEAVEFFHDKAITTTSIARIALKYDINLIPARSIRIAKDCKFEVEIGKPVEFEAKNDLNQDILDLTRIINIQLEDWIRQYPSQWFWVHNRWKK